MPEKPHITIFKTYDPNNDTKEHLEVSLITITCYFWTRHNQSISQCFSYPFLWNTQHYFIFSLFWIRDLSRAPLCDSPASPALMGLLGCPESPKWSHSHGWQSCWLWLELSHSHRPGALDLLYVDFSMWLLCYLTAWQQELKMFFRFWRHNLEIP